MKINLAVLLIVVLLAISCKITTKQEISPYDELVKNPMTADKAIDTVNIAKLHFPQKKYDFGFAKSGDSIVHEFHFYNTGKASLLITNVSSSCGCTVPKIYKDKLEPGDSSILKVVFNTKDKISYQEKKITIIANTFPPETEVSLSGYIRQ